jgi:hypothetical protein
MKNLFTLYSQLKNKHLLLLFVGIGLCFSGHSKNADSTSHSKKPASFIEVNSAFGRVFNTNTFVENIPSYQAISLRYARASNGSTWEDFAYHMPFFGIGFYRPFFVNNPGLGNPFSIYMFRGSTLKQFTDNLGLVFELNLGLSMNWKPYDVFDNPDNTAIGSPNNVHVGMKLYFEYVLSRNFELKFGTDLNHFSNGSSRKPNKGINMGALSVSLAYNFNPPNKGHLLRNPPLFKPPVDFPSHLEHDVKFIISSRQTEFSTEGTNLPSPYVDTDFTVLGLSYSPMFVRGYRYKWGPSVRLIYDESSNAKAWREENPADGLWYDRVKTAPFEERLSLGLGLTGEISMPVASVFATVGYNVYHTHHDDKPFFQVIGVKAYLQENFYGTFGISATQFSVAQFLYWSFGYTFSSAPRYKK